SSWPTRAASSHRAPEHAPLSNDRGARREDLSFGRRRTRRRDDDAGAPAPETRREMFSPSRRSPKMSRPVEFHDLSKQFGGVAAVEHLSFGIEAGRVTGFLGPNGAGKSTTIRALLGLI